MILKDEQRTLKTKILVLGMWEFRIECDKCKGRVGVTMQTRDETQWFVYDKLGWRANPKARKYAHICRRCAGKGGPSGSRVK